MVYARMTTEELLRGLQARVTETFLGNGFSSEQVDDLLADSKECRVTTHQMVTTILDAANAYIENLRLTGNS